MVLYYIRQKCFGIMCLVSMQIQIPGVELLVIDVPLNNYKLTNKTKSKN